MASSVPVPAILPLLALCLIGIASSSPLYGHPQQQQQHHPDSVAAINPPSPNQPAKSGSDEVPPPDSFQFKVVPITPATTESPEEPDSWQFKVVTLTTESPPEEINPDEVEPEVFPDGGGVPWEEQFPDAMTGLLANAAAKLFRPYAGYYTEEPSTTTEEAPYPYPDGPCGQGPDASVPRAHSNLPQPQMPPVPQMPPTQPPPSSSSPTTLTMFQECMGSGLDPSKCCSIFAPKSNQIREYCEIAVQEPDDNEK